MPVSRRKLLRQIGVGAFVGAAAPALSGFGRVAGGAGPRVATAEDPVLLYRNENPYGPSEKVLAVLRESVTSGNRYPRTEC